MNNLDVQILVSKVSSVANKEIQILLEVLIDSIKTNTDITRQDLKHFENVCFENSNTTSFLSKLNVLLIDNPNKHQITHFLNAYDLKVFSDIAFDIRKTYIQCLAEKYFANEDSLDISTLVVNHDLDFFNHLNFLNDLKDAIVFNQRQELKKKLQLADVLNEFELPEEEIKTAVTEVERSKLKKLFRSIDEQEFEETMPREAVNKNVSSKVISFKSFFRYAAAAVVFGFVAFSGYYLMTSKSPDKKNANTNLSSNDHKEITIPSVDIIAEQKTKVYSVLAPESFGIFTPKKVKITITVINTGKYIRQTRVYLDSLERRFTMEINSNPKAGYGPVAKEIQTRIDSLKTKLELLTLDLNTYTFNQKTCRTILYLSDDMQVDKVMSVNLADRSVFYIKLKKEFYKIQSSIKPQRLIPETNKAIIEELDKIEFQNS